MNLMTPSFLLYPASFSSPPTAVSLLSDAIESGLWGQLKHRLQSFRESEEKQRVLWHTEALEDYFCPFRWFQWTIKIESLNYNFDKDMNMGNTVLQLYF